MSRIVQKFDFDRKFQAKLVRILFQFSDETKDVLNELEPSMFDSAPMQWCVRKFQWASAKGLTPTRTVLDCEAEGDVSNGLIKPSHVGAYASFLGKLKRKVPDKSYILSKTHDYVRTVLLRDHVLFAAEKLADGKKLDWPKVFKQMDRVRQVGEMSEGGLGQDYCSDLDARIERRKSFIHCGVPTGIHGLDIRLRHGGLPPKQLGVAVAPPAKGKSAVLVHMCCAAVRSGRTALFVSVELDEDMISDRVDARISLVPMNDLDDNRDKVREKVSRKIAKWGGQLRIKYFPPASLTIDGLNAYLKRLEAVSFYPDVLFLDYADNMSLKEYGSGYSDNDYGPIGRLYVALRGLAGERNIPIWTASQANRESLKVGKSKVIGQQHLADSFKKAMVADVMFSLGGEEGISFKNINFSIIKNRNGPTGDNFLVSYQPGIVKFSENATE
jgi:hypothetical protein